MLLRKHGGRHEDRRLLAVEHALHHRAQRDLRFAVAYVAAEQAVHRARRFSMSPLISVDAAQLIVRLRIAEASSNSAATGFRREGEARRAAARGIELDEPLGQILCRGLGAAFVFVHSVPPSLLSLTGGPRRRRCICDTRSSCVAGTYRLSLPGVGDLDIILLRAVHRHAARCRQSGRCRGARARRGRPGVRSVRKRSLWTARTFFCRTARGALPLTGARSCPSVRMTRRSCGYSSASARRGR